MTSGLRINAGSGQRPFGKTWTNLDVQERWRQPAIDKGGEFLCCDMSQMPFPDGSAEVVVAHHVAEHMDAFREGVAFIREANRILKPGGSFLVFVPDLEALARAWLNGKIDDYIYCVNLYGAWMGDEADRHKWGWSAPSLIQQLSNNAEWSDVYSFNWRELPGADIARDWWILGMEAVK